MGIPVVVGVTGHRALRTQDIPLLREKVKQELENLRASCPHSDIIMLNSVASGGDSLCAECALELGITLICPLPFPAEEYRKDFSAVYLFIKRHPQPVYTVDMLMSSLQGQLSGAFKLLMILDILKEQGLITYTKQCEQLHIGLVNVNVKVNLELSASYQKLKEDIDHVRSNA